MKTLLRLLAVIALLLWGLQWPIPVNAQSIEPNIPVRPHETDNAGSDLDNDLIAAIRPKVGPRGEVSVRQFAHKPPKAARKEFDQGTRDWRNGHRATAMQHLTAAVRLDPDYAQAHARIGEWYLKEGEPSLALSHLDQALAIYPKSEVLECNKAWALLRLLRAPEAEQAARRAVELAPGSVTAHYLLSLALLQQNRATAETAEHLEFAIGKHPELREGLAWVLEQLRISEFHSPN